MPAHANIPSFQPSSQTNNLISYTGIYKNGAWPMTLNIDHPPRRNKTKKKNPANMTNTTNSTIVIGDCSFIQSLTQFIRYIINHKYLKCNKYLYLNSIYCGQSSELAMWDTDSVLCTLSFIDAFLIGPPCIFVQLQTLLCPGNAVSMIFSPPSISWDEGKQWASG